MRQKEVRITYHELVKRSVKNGVESEAPYKEVPQLLEYIVNLPIKKRFFDLKDDKFCYLDELKRVPDQDLYFGVMESARSSFRPKLIDKTSGSKRLNPRGLSEGDIERTHFLVGVFPNEVKLFIEFNHSGVRVNSFVNYLKLFVKAYSKKINKQPCDYSILHIEVAPISFMTQLESALKASSVEMFIDKRILGSNFLRFSERTVAVRRDVVLTVNSKRNEDIKTLAMDLFAAFNDTEKGISRIRVRAKNPDNHDVMIDTQAFCMKSVFNVDVNEDTGELNSNQVFQQLRHVAESYA